MLAIVPMIMTSMTVALDEQRALPMLAVVSLILTSVMVAADRRARPRAEDNLPMLAVVSVVITSMMVVALPMLAVVLMIMTPVTVVADGRARPRAEDNLPMLAVVSAVKTSMMLPMLAVVLMMADRCARPRADELPMLAVVPMIMTSMVVVADRQRVRSVHAVVSKIMTSLMVVADGHVLVFVDVAMIMTSAMDAEDKLPIQAVVWTMLVVDFAPKVPVVAVTPLLSIVVDGSVEAGPLVTNEALSLSREQRSRLAGRRRCGLQVLQRAKPSTV
jgi:hypothetical protein